MENQEFFNRTTGANGCDLISDAIKHEFPEPVSAIIVQADATQIVEAEYVDPTKGSDDLTAITANYLSTDLGLQTLITFKYPISTLTLGTGSVMVYFV